MGGSWAAREGDRKSDKREDRIGSLKEGAHRICPCLSRRQQRQYVRRRTVLSGFVSLTSCVIRAQFSPLREVLKGANGGGREVLHDVRRGWRRWVWRWMNDTMPCCSPVSASREGGFVGDAGAGCASELEEVMARLSVGMAG